MGHHHDHSKSTKNLSIAFFLNLGFTILEIFGGLFVNSVAILSDAIHDLGDSLSLGIAWYLQRKSSGKPDSRFSFGYARFSLLGAVINGLILIAGSIFVLNEAIARIAEPQNSNAQGMLVFALFGIAVNGYAAWKLSGGKSLNEKVVTWHLLEDVLGWVAVLIVSVILLFKNVPFLDPALSILITIYVLYNVVKRLRETVNIFLQRIPEGIDREAIEQNLLSVNHVESLHHMHIWSLEGEQHVLTTHVKLANIDSFQDLLKVKENIKEIVSSYGFQHFTIETELNEETCNLDSDEGIEKQ